MSGASLDENVARVVTSGRCSGCGACTLLDDGLEMQLSDGGFLRPVRVRPSQSDEDDARRFEAACPGSTVRARRHHGARYHPTLGPVLACWEARAADPEIRRQGSSGGVLTALSSWLVSTGQATHVVGAAAATTEPRRTVPVKITTRDEALAAAGSRYAPVAVASHPDALDPRGATTAKPCEIAALRGLAADGPAPLMLSFFCAGTPSAHATDAVLEKLDVPRGAPLTDLWYRGRGWPGRFTARLRDGREVSTSYEESWGSTLGRAVQWRCKLCPDGIGESSDVTAGDMWRSDDRGYPVFTESDGFSALIARTERGLALVEEAIAAGVLEARTVSPDEVAAVQPLQRTRRAMLAARLAGARFGGASVPRYRGFGLVRLALSDVPGSIRSARDTYRRVRSGSAYER